LLYDSATPCRVAAGSWSGACVPVLSCVPALPGANGCSLIYAGAPCCHRPCDCSLPQLALPSQVRSAAACYPLPRSSTCPQRWACRWRSGPMAPIAGCTRPRIQHQSSQCCGARQSLEQKASALPWPHHFKYIFAGRRVWMSLWWRTCWGGGRKRSCCGTKGCCGSAPCCLSFWSVASRWVSHPVSACLKSSHECLRSHAACVAKLCGVLVGQLDLGRAHLQPVGDAFWRVAALAERVAR